MMACLKKKATVLPEFGMTITVYNTCTRLLNDEKYVDANLDAPDNAISGNEPSSEILTGQSHKLE